MFFPAHLPSSALTPGLREPLTSHQALPVVKDKWLAQQWVWTGEVDSTVKEVKGMANPACAFDGKCSDTVL